MDIIPTNVSILFVLHTTEITHFVKIFGKIPILLGVNMTCKKETHLNQYWLY